MILKGSLEKSQKSGAQFYLRLSQLFESNQLIHNTWVAMAQDMEQQALGLETLPSSLWKKLKDESAPLLEASKASLSAQKLEKEEHSSLHICFEHTLNLEEPLVLKAYVPIIRRLRAESTDQALEFYIMVKAHVTRILRLIQPLAGDPGILSRVTSLQEQFEHEVQAPDAVQAKRFLKKKGASAHTKSRSGKSAKAAARKPKSVKRVLPLNRRSGAAKRVKPLVGKLELRRKRARG